MEKGEQILAEFWEIFQKKILLENYEQNKRLNGYKPSEIHCIQYIGGHSDSNVTKIAESFRMTTGGVTKLTQRLIEKDLIRAYKNPGNKKEIFFQLTNQGEKIYKIHEELHKKFSERDASLFEQISDEEYSFLLHFASTYSRHLDGELQKSGIDIKSGRADTL
ncbi:MAG: MarR family transcriptional regulator [Lachnospiraceae bacterium]|nr:MarR family transcriptional regulator [Lachnospiraceae bacterium]